MAAMLSVQAMAGGAYFEIVRNGQTQAIGPDDYQAIGETEITTKVISMGDDERVVKGVLGRKLLDYVKSEGQTVTIVALDGYAMEVPVEDLVKYDVVVATEIDGKKLSIRDKGPAWLIYPISTNKELEDTVYESRSVRQIKTITIQ
jgi:hypothetical protein